MHIWHLFLASGSDLQCSSSCSSRAFDYLEAFFFADVRVQRILMHQPNKKEFLFSGTEGNYIKIPSRSLSNGWYRTLTAQVFLKLGIPFSIFHFTKGVLYLKVKQSIRTTIELSPTGYNYFLFYTDWTSKKSGHPLRNALLFLPFHLIPCWNSVEIASANFQHFMLGVWSGGELGW